MAVTIYNRAKYDLMTAAASLATADVRALLVTSAYTPDPDHQFVASITGEVVAANYVRKVLSNKTVARDDAADVSIFDADNVLWSALGACSPARVVLFRQVTNDADSPLIACLDLTSPPTANGTDYSVVWSASGILRL